MHREILKRKIMETKKFSELKGSEKLKFQAAVLEVLERQNFNLDKDLGMKESQDNPNNWVMGFTNSAMSLEDLDAAKGSLGANFKITICPKSKDSFIFRIEAAGRDYLGLFQKIRPMSQHQPTL